MARNILNFNNLLVIMVFTITIFLATTPVHCEEVFDAPDCFNETLFKAGFKVCQDRYIAMPLKKKVSLTVHVSLEIGSYFFFDFLLKLFFWPLTQKCCSMKAYAKCFEMITESHCQLAEDAEKVNRFALGKMNLFLGFKGLEDCDTVSELNCLDPAFIKVYFGLGAFLVIVGFSFWLFICHLVSEDEVFAEVNVQNIEDMETLL